MGTQTALLTLALTYFFSLKKRTKEKKKAVVKSAFRLMSAVASSCESLALTQRYSVQQIMEKGILNLFVV